jgi:hypothetical protein
MNNYHLNEASKRQYDAEAPELQWAEDSINGLFALFVETLGRLLYVVGWVLYSVVFFVFALLSALLKR